MSNLESVAVDNTDAQNPEENAIPAAKNETSISLTLQDIIQEYPNPGTKPTRVVDGVSLAFDKPHGRLCIKNRHSLHP